MHPLQYRLEDFEKLLNKKITIKYKTFSNKIEILEGYLIRVHPTNLGDILPHSITLDLGREQRTVNVFDIETINSDNNI